MFDKMIFGDEKIGASSEIISQAKARRFPVKIDGVTRYLTGSEIERNSNLEPPEGGKLSGDEVKLKYACRNSCQQVMDFVIEKQIAKEKAITSGRTGEAHDDFFQRAKELYNKAIRERRKVESEYGGRIDEINASVLAAEPFKKLKEASLAEAQAEMFRKTDEMKEELQEELKSLKADYKSFLRNFYSFKLAEVDLNALEAIKAVPINDEIVDGSLREFSKNPTMCRAILKLSDDAGITTMLAEAVRKQVDGQGLEEAEAFFRLCDIPLFIAGRSDQALQVWEDLSMYEGEYNRLYDIVTSLPLQP